MKDFLLRLFLFILIISALNICWIYFAPTTLQIPHIWPMIGFFTAITLLFHNLSLNAAKGKPQGFVRFYMGSTALRLFGYMLVILVYRFYDKPTLIPFAVGFMAHYFLFTLFEVPLLLKELKKS